LQAEVQAHARWPLIEYHLAACAAGRDLEQRRQGIADTLALLRDSSHLVAGSTGDAPGEVPLAA
jgi:hypothetical protein